MDNGLKHESAKKESKKLIAETMAQRVLAQLDAGKKNEDVMKDLDKDKKRVSAVTFVSSQQYIKKCSQHQSGNLAF